MAIEKCNIRNFMNAWFNDDYSIISKEEFQILYEEYIDITESYISETFDKTVYVRGLTGRVNCVALNIKLQRDFTNQFGKPYIEMFKLLEEFGYFIEYTTNDLFFEELEKIEYQEKVFISELELSLKELEELNDSKVIDNTPIKKSRESFIRLINTLGKIGYKIDMERTTVEEFAIMIKQQKEENQ